MENDNMLVIVQNFGREWINCLTKCDITQTKAGSIKYLLHGSRPSDQSISIKVGKLGELITKEIIKTKSNLELLQCGVQIVNENIKKKKDIDLIWANHNSKTIYIRELKGNIELDTEKLPATFEKIKNDIQTFIQSKYPDYTIDIGILNWSVYCREELTTCLSHIKKCQDNGVKVEHMGDFLKLIDFQWDEKNYYAYFRELGSIIDTYFAKV